MKLTKGGYLMISLPGLNIAQTTGGQSIPGSWNEAKKAVEYGKPVLIYDTVYGSYKNSPVYGFAHYVSDTVINIEIGYRYIRVQTNNGCGVGFNTDSSINTRLTTLETDVTNNKEAIIDLEDTVLGLVNNVSDITGDIEDLQTADTGILNSISDLDERVTTLENA